MAYSYVRYTAGGSTSNFTFSFPYIDKTHIVVRKDGVDTTAFTFLNDSTIAFNTAPAAGTLIEIRRFTPKDVPIVDFQDGSILLEKDLDLSVVFNLYIAQEADDIVKESIFTIADGTMTASGRRISNVANPVNAQDAVTKAWAETAMTSELGQAIVQAGVATTKATEASNSATAAAGSAATATTKAGEASSSATGAAASAATATTKASEAAASAANAATNAATITANIGTATTAATAASASASAAATSATSAAASASSAAALLDNFDDRYLGSKTSAPSVDNDGDALLLGALYFDSVTGKMRVYTASGWVDASSASIASLIDFEFVATAGQTTFSGNDASGVALAYTVGALIVSLNGAVLRSNEYTASNGTSIVLASAATAGDELVVYAFNQFLVADTYTKGEADGFLASKVSLAGAQTLTGSKRGTVTTDNDGSFDMAVTNNFKCTPTGTFTLTFTNITSGQSGYVLLDNSGGFSVSAAATTKVNASFLATVSAAGTYLLSYFSDGTNVYVTTGGVMA